MDFGTIEFSRVIVDGTELNGSGDKHPDCGGGKDEIVVTRRLNSTLDTGMQALSHDFFDRHHLSVARDLLGCTLVWDGVSGIVVETEAYAADDDEACHTSFRSSARAFFQQHGPGTTYVYLNYGMYWLLNVLARDGIILFRAMEPRSGLPVMESRRNTTVKSSLCSGPGRLGRALGLTAQDHGSVLLSDSRHLMPRDESFDATIIQTDVRVGITREIDRPWRFLIAGNEHVSVASGKANARNRGGRQRRNSG
jgi:DNA-3-methyladenine glycosylase